LAPLVVVWSVARGAASSRPFNPDLAARN